MKKLLMVIAMVMMFLGCEQTAEMQQREQTKELMNEMGRQVGMPNIRNFYEKRIAKDIFELRDQADLITYTYTTAMNGKYIYQGQSIGYGLPYSVQYTAPERVVSRYSVTVPQADPNGLYMPDGLSATWILLRDENTGKISPVYFEDNITVSQFKFPPRLIEKWSLPENY